MTVKNIIKRHIDGHRIFFFLILCLFGLCLVQAMQAPKKRARKRPHGDRVYLLHADELRYDMYGPHPDAQIVKGKVSFSHRDEGHTYHIAAHLHEASKLCRHAGASWHAS